MNELQHLGLRDLGRLGMTDLFWFSSYDGERIPLFGQQRNSFFFAGIEQQEVELEDVSGPPGCFCGDEDEGRDYIFRLYIQIIYVTLHPASARPRPSYRKVKVASSFVSVPLLCLCVKLT